MRAGRGERFPPDASGEPPPRSSRLARAALAVGPIGVLVVCLSLVPLPLFLEAPGPARDVVPRIDIDGTRTYEPKGRLLLTTVRLGRVTAFEAVRAWADPAIAVVPERDILAPGVTDQEFERLSLSQMDSSKIAAVVVALRRTTDYPRERGRGVVVQAVVPDTPAATRLFPGDLIVSVDGERLRGPAHLRALIRGAGAGTDLRLAVRPVEGGRRQVVRIAPATPPGEADPIIGIIPVWNFPFRVAISSGDIGGPSAGLMWALGVIDMLTPGDLTGGRTVAGTGDVDLGGGVRGIGGIRLKIAAAELAGARAFLLPRDNLDEARGAGADIELVPVDTVAQAVDYLER